MTPAAQLPPGRKRVRIKICGLTVPEEAVRCAELGADAIGLVFYTRSPRAVTLAGAQSICNALPAGIKRVGVFVDETPEAVRSIVASCGLDIVQLHGNESFQQVDRFNTWEIPVIKALFTGRSPGLETAPDYRAAAFLVEHGTGPLPGGNAREWSWKTAAGFSNRYPLVIAGGLSPDNVGGVIQGCRPAAVDVSSGVESSPGCKDMERVARFIDAVARIPVAASATGPTPF